MVTNSVTQALVIHEPAGDCRQKLHRLFILNNVSAFPNTLYQKNILAQAFFLYLLGIFVTSLFLIYLRTARSVVYHVVPDLKASKRLRRMATLSESHVKPYRLYFSTASGNLNRSGGNFFILFG
jgi:hypothetical protein